MLIHWILLFVIAQTVFSQQCPSGYILDTRNNRCFKVSTDTQNYVGAMAYCNRDGGFLATIENGFINSFVGSLSRMESGKSYYIGLNSLMQGAGVWTWVDGTAYAYSNWAPGQSQGGQCAAIQGGTNLWRNPSCSSKLPYICVTDPVSQTIQPTPRHALCETAWMYFNKTDSCYKTFTGSRTNHADAEATCVKAGGHLTSIHSYEENYFVSVLSGTGMAQGGTNQVIIGLRLLINAWSWTDGTPFDYQIWAPGAPWSDQSYGYLYADEWTGGEGYRYKFDNYSNSGTTFRAFVCKKRSLP